MSLRNRVQQLQKHKKKLDPIELIVRVMKYFGWTLEEVKQLSIPSFLLIITTINEIEKKPDKGKTK